MDKLRIRVMQTLDRADYWLDGNMTIFAGNQAVEANHRALKASIARAKQYAAQQDPRLAPKVVTSADQQALRNRIVAELRDIAQLSRRLRKTIPGIGALVAPSNESGVVPFLRNAESFMEKAAIYAQVLIEHGMSPDFVTSIKAELRHLEEIVLTRSAARSGRVTATVSLSRELKEGLAIVDLIDVSVKRALRDSDPGKLAGWQAAKKLGVVSTSRPELIPMATSKIQAA